jgi:methanol--5-hydroxybenzimidazolylcobamide Co-methyltransferase
MQTFPRLAIADPAGLQFGTVPQPLDCGFGLRLGAGMVFPELNFTLPPVTIEPSTWQEVLAHYREIGEMIVRASRRLRLPGLVVEFELLPPMTETPAWGAEITSILHGALAQAHKEYGLPSGSGAHIFSIESVGGKEVHDEALMYGDVRGAMFALGVLAPRDMEWLWKAIVEISRKHGVVPGGDSACGFANTAMQLAGQGMLPEVLATVIRAASAVRSLVAYECGAMGPSKDCAYEGPVLKAITGTTIAMEGKSAACAHFSPVGNVAAAMCDLWSNESVQNVRLLSGSAPEAYLELLAYDCRLFNQAIKQNVARQYQSMLVNSDTGLSPQALILSPESTVKIASAIVAEKSHYAQTVAAARTSVTIMKEAIGQKGLTLAPREIQWLDKISLALDDMPDREESLLEEMAGTYGHKFLPASYGL